MTKLLHYFYYILLTEYVVLFLILAMNKRIRFFRLLYLSTRETSLLTILMTAVFVSIRYFQYQEALVSSARVFTFLFQMLVSLGSYYLIFVILYFSTSISFNIVRQSSTFVAVMTPTEKLKLLAVPFFILLLNLYLSAAMIKDYY